MIYDILVKRQLGPIIIIGASRGHFFLPIVESKQKYILTFLRVFPTI